MSKKDKVEEMQEMEDTLHNEESQAEVNEQSQGEQENEETIELSREEELEGELEKEKDKFLRLFAEFEISKGGPLKKGWTFSKLQDKRSWFPFFRYWTTLNAP